MYSILSVDEEKVFGLHCATYLEILVAMKVYTRPGPMTYVSYNPQFSLGFIPPYFTLSCFATSNTSEPDSMSRHPFTKIRDSQ